jgi:hypothetical protein
VPWAGLVLLGLAAVMLVEAVRAIAGSPPTDAPRVLGSAGSLAHS